MGRGETPEEQELGRKKVELAALEGELAEAELVLATQRAEVFLFERRYMREVGVLYARLDDLEALLAEALALRQPANNAARTRAEEARRQADETAGAAAAGEDGSSERVELSEDLKKLYRQLVHQVHPDLVLDPAEKLRREAAFKAMQSAYERGDAQGMLAAAAALGADPSAVKGEDVGAQLVRAIRQIAQVRRRLEAVREEIGVLAASSMFELWQKAQEAEADGRDLIGDLAAELNKKVEELVASLTVLAGPEQSG